MNAAQTPILERNSVSLAGFDDFRKSLWIFIFTIVGFAVFYTFGSLALGSIILLLSFIRIGVNACTLSIAWWKRPIIGARAESPVVLRFSAGEGYPADICFIAAFRIAGETGPFQYCLAFPVPMDNVFQTSDEALRCVNGINATHVFRHPFERSKIFVDDSISVRQRIDLLIRIIGWSVFAAAGGFLMLSEQVLF